MRKCKSWVWSLIGHPVHRPLLTLLGVCQRGSPRACDQWGPLSWTRPVRGLPSPTPLSLDCPPCPQFPQWALSSRTRPWESDAAGAEPVWTGYVTEAREASVLPLGFWQMDAEIYSPGDAPRQALRTGPLCLLSLPPPTWSSHRPLPSRLPSSDCTWKLPSLCTDPGPRDHCWWPQPGSASSQLGETPSGICASVSSAREESGQ